MNEPESLDSNKIDLKKLSKEEKKAYFLSKKTKKVVYNDSESYRIPVRLLIENKYQLPVLSLFLRLKRIAIQKAGYVPREVYDKLTHREKYIYLAKLKKLGWVDKNNKLKSVYKILQENHPDEALNNVHCTISNKFINNRKKLKEFIFAITEQYILQGKYLSEKRGYWDMNEYKKKLIRKQIKRVNKGSKNEELYKTERILLSDEDQRQVFSEEALSSEKVLQSRISHSMLTMWGYTSREISRLRKSKLNSYGEREHMPVDQYEELSFYSRKDKKCFKILPTKVIAACNNIFYYNRLGKATSPRRELRRCQIERDSRPLFKFHDPPKRTNLSLSRVSTALSLSNYDSYIEGSNSIKNTILIDKSIYNNIDIITIEGSIGRKSIFSMG